MKPNQISRRRAGKLPCSQIALQDTNDTCAHGRRSGGWLSRQRRLRKVQQTADPKQLAAAGPHRNQRLKRYIITFILQDCPPRNWQIRSVNGPNTRARAARSPSTPWDCPVIDELGVAIVRYGNRCLEHSTQRSHCPSSNHVRRQLKRGPTGSEGACDVPRAKSFFGGAAPSSFPSISVAAIVSRTENGTVRAVRHGETPGG